MPASAPAAVRPAALAVSVLAVSLVLLLTGCTDDPDPLHSGTPRPSESTTPTTEPTTDPGEEVDHSLSLACDDLVSPDTIYAFNPNFVLLGEWIPDAGSAAADALEAEGVACRWVNQTSGDTLDVSVAGFDDDDLTELKNAAFAESQMVPTYGEEAYFEVNDGVGTAIVFDRSYWLVVTSPSLLEPGEATDLVNAALGVLP